MPVTHNTLSSQVKCNKIQIKRLADIKGSKRKDYESDAIYSVTPCKDFLSEILAGIFFL